MGKPAWRVLVADDLMHALAELGIRIGREACADALIGGGEGLAAILAHVMAAGRDPQVHAVSIAQNGMHAEPAVAGIPLAGVLVVANAACHFPGITAIVAPEQRRRLDAAP